MTSNINIIMTYQNNNSDQNYLDLVVSALHRKKKLSATQKQEEDMSLQKLYQTMNNVVSGLDQNISECKKYNQAKIHRKYQIIIKDQQKRISFLEQKVKEEHKARSPSKKYIEDLLDKLINFKFQIEKLNKQNNQLTLLNSQLKKKLQIYENNLSNHNKIQIQEEQEQKKQLTQISGANIKNQVTTFLNLKYELRKNDNLLKSRFQRYLKKIKDRLHGWTMRQFLQNIDQWSSQMLQAVQPQKIEHSADPLAKTLITKVPMLNYPNRNIMAKTQARNRRTISNRHFIQNNSFNDNILR